MKFACLVYECSGVWRLVLTSHPSLNSDGETGRSVFFHPGIHKPDQSLMNFTLVAGVCFWKSIGWHFSCPLQGHTVLKSINTMRICRKAKNMSFQTYDFKLVILATLKYSICYYINHCQDLTMLVTLQRSITSADSYITVDFTSVYVDTSSWIDFLVLTHKEYSSHAYISTYNIPVIVCIVIRWGIICSEG